MRVGQLGLIGDAPQPVPDLTWQSIDPCQPTVVVVACGLLPGDEHGIDHDEGPGRVRERCRMVGLGDSLAHTLSSTLVCKRYWGPIQFQDCKGRHPLSAQAPVAAGPPQAPTSPHNGGLDSRATPAFPNLDSPHTFELLGSGSHIPSCMQCRYIDLHPLSELSPLPVIAHDYLHPHAVTPVQQARVDPRLVASLLVPSTTHNYLTARPDRDRTAVSALYILPPPQILGPSHNGAVGLGFRPGRHVSHLPRRHTTEGIDRFSGQHQGQRICRGQEDNDTTRLRRVQKAEDVS